MRRVCLLAVAILVLLVEASRAGLYNTAEPDAKDTLSTDFYTFLRNTLIPLRQIGSTETDTPLNKRYQLMARLPRTGDLTVEDRLILGAYLIRVRKYRDAVQVLKPAYDKERDNFLVLANLATAEQLDNKLQRAEVYLAEARRVWPAKFHDLPQAKQKWLGQIGWNEGPYAWYREVEKYHHDLLKLRNKEPPPSGLPEAPDSLFGPVSFVGESGKFEPGKLARAEQAKLPKDAILIVEQLLVWLPDDMRLYWLLGELFNAEGKIDEARDILEEIDRKWNPKGALVAFRKSANPKLFQEHLDLLRAHPRSPPVIDIPIDPPVKPPAKGIDEPPASRFDWRALGVGVLLGLLIALFGYWQIREIRRRRQSRAGV